MRHANFLASSTQVDTTFPVQPVGAGTQPRSTPAMRIIIFTDQFQQTVGGGMDVSRQFGDLVFEVFTV